jgi:hypothetical protein
LTISFVLGAIHEKHHFKYLKNLTVKVCKTWGYDVSMYILYCDILASNIYMHLFLVEREYFGFNTLESVIVE